MAEPQWLNEREMRTWESFLAANALVSRQVEQHLKAEGLSHTQYEVLVRLSAASGGAVRMTELADALYTSKSGLNYQIAQLEKAGLVRREACPTDIRGVLAVITETGQHRLTEVAPGHVATVRKALIDVLTPAQQEAIANGLGTVARNLTAESD